MKKSKSVQEVYPLTFETFHKIGSWGINTLTQKDPSVFNDEVSIYRYRVTIEKIDEPVEILSARLQELWDICDNYHHWQPLKQVANEIGYVLRGNPGSRRKIK